MVSDGFNEVKCLCISVPLPNDREPQVGMEVLKIYAFTVNKLEIMKVLKEKDKNFYISKTPLIGFDYKINESAYYSSLINKGDKKGFVEIRKKNKDELDI